MENPKSNPFGIIEDFLSWTLVEIWIRIVSEWKSKVIQWMLICWIQVRYSGMVVLQVQLQQCFMEIRFWSESLPCKALELWPSDIHTELEANFKSSSPGPRKIPLPVSSSCFTRMSYSTWVWWGLLSNTISFLYVWVPLWYRVCSSREC